MFIENTGVKMFKRSISLIICIAFLCTGNVPPVMGQEFFLPPAGSVVSLSTPSAPLLLKGMKVDAKDPLHMDFLVDKGHAPVSDASFNDESLRLIKYFLASLTIPEKDLWVNLSPYEGDRIIQDDFGRTGMGRDLLAQDYILKQLTAGLLHPDGATGKVFWAEVYKQAYDQFGTTDIPVDTFNKVWIVPSKSVVYESRSPDGKKVSAFVQDMKLKVMLETDYLATSNNPLPSELALDAKASEGTNPATSALAKDILREVVIPVLEKEVNEGANFALLRQVSYSLVLSVWLKKKLMTSALEVAQADIPTGNILSRIFINRHKTQGIEIADPEAQTQLIYDRYVEAFKRGAYDLIKEEVDTYSQELIPRKYFSGGWSAKEVDNAMVIYDAAQLPGVDASRFNEVNVDLSQAAGDKFKQTGERTFEWEIGESEKESREDQPARVVDFDDLFEQEEGSVEPRSRTGFKRSELFGFVKRIFNDVREAPLFKQSNVNAISRRDFLRKAVVGGVGVAVVAGTGVGVSRLLKVLSEDGTKTDQPNVPRRSGKISSQDVMDTLKRIGKNHPSFERIRSGKDSWEYRSDVLFKRMTGKTFSEEEANKFTKAFQQYFDDFCPGIKEAGGNEFGVREMFELVSSIMLIESDFRQLRSQNDADKYAHGFSFFQFEPNSIETLLEETRDFWDKEGEYLTPSKIDLKSQILKFAKKFFDKKSSDPLWNGSDKGNLANTWNVKRVKESQLKSLDVQLALVLMFMEDVFTRDFLAKEDGFLIENKHIFDKYKPEQWPGIEKEITKKRRAPVHALSGLVKRYPELSRVEIIKVMLATNHKAGGPRSMEDYIQVIDVLIGASKIQSFEKKRAHFVKEKEAAEERLEKAIDARKPSLSAMREFLKKRKVIFSDPDWRAFARGNSVMLADIVRRLGKRKGSAAVIDDDIKTFLGLILKDWEPLSVMRDMQRGSGNVDAGKYASLSLVLAKEVPLEKSKDQAQQDNSEIVGGIDLSEQESAMDILGQSGTFNLDLSPEQMKILDQGVRGFLPIIINIQPVKDVKMFLGVRSTDESSVGS